MDFAMLVTYGDTNKLLGEHLSEEQHSRLIHELMHPMRSRTDAIVWDHNTATYCTKGESVRNLSLKRAWLCTVR